MTRSPSEQEPYAVEVAVNQAIAACDGDQRATIRALIIANTLLEDEIAEIVELYCSSGFHRGKLHARELP